MLNIGWLAAFHFKMIDVSVVLIIALWCVVFTLYSAFSRPGSPLWAKAPFALYFGWLCVAVDMAISTALFALSAAGALAIYIPLGVEKYRSGRRAVSSMRNT